MICNIHIVNFRLELTRSIVSRISLLSIVSRISLLGQSTKDRRREYTWPIGQSGSWTASAGVSNVWQVVPRLKAEQHDTGCDSVSLGLVVPPLEAHHQGASCLAVTAPALVARISPVVDFASRWITHHSRACGSTVAARASVASVDREHRGHGSVYRGTNSFGRDAQRQQNRQQRQILHLGLLCRFQPWEQLDW